ncbi:MAG: hypothetical protein BGO21_05995 [Dyadobacter sp. 50-39]|mgnify:CR=1 FL=1|uniref:O-antigen ligase family protein n=1 Tax=Dyadobacter sp. 50-39 TaxID=1895756 RepID=UPI00095D96EA|nr:O-antigen ligase family protein [Dyadobacter sp. 50-39]OJV12301.1 MAG: hypothetical protein BGO21_05995 [Dyadobacter sp. 50-39]
MKKELFSYGTQNTWAIFFLTLIALSVFATSDEVSNGNILAKYLHIDLVTTAVITAFGINLFIRKKYSIEFSLIDILVAIFATYVSVQSLIQGSILSLDYINFFALVATYYAIVIFLRHGIVKADTLVTIFLVTCTLQSIYGTLQHSNNQIVKGSFNNPGPYAIYIANLAVLAATVLFRHYSKIEFVPRRLELISICAIFFAAISMLFADSRTSWISATVGIVSLIFIFLKSIKYRPRFTSRGILLLGLGSIAAFIFVIWLYRHKENSADGRLVVWKVATQMASENPLFGLGPFSFDNHYGTFQANYFACNGVKSNEATLADQVDYAYNDFLQITVELGLIGLLLFLAILILALRNINCIGFPMLTSCVAGALTSYPAEGAPTILNFLIAIALCAFNSGSAWKFQFQRTKPAAGALALVAVLVIIFATLDWRRRTEYYAAIRLYNSDEFKESIKIFQKIDSEYQIKDSEALSYFAKSLAITGLHNKALVVYERALAIKNEYYLNLNYGITLEETGHYNNAEVAYIAANNMIPNRVYPKYLLSKYYARIGDRSRADYMASKVIEMNEKVPSVAIREMKEEMRKYLNQKTIHSAEP